MGFSTNVTIQNDFFHDIAKDPQALVDAIQIGMNYGTGHSPLRETLAARQDATDFDRRHEWEMRFLKPQGVTVHKAQHNDVPQVIVNTYGSHAIAAHELPYAIQRGWLGLNKYNKKHAQEVANELGRLARDITKAIKDQEAKEHE